MRRIVHQHILINKRFFDQRRYCNEGNNFLYVNGVKINQLKEKHSEIKPYLLYLSNVLKDFTDQLD